MPEYGRNRINHPQRGGRTNPAASFSFRTGSPDARLPRSTWFFSRGSPRLRKRPLQHTGQIVLQHVETSPCPDLSRGNQTALGIHGSQAGFAGNDTVHKAAVTDGFPGHRLEQLPASRALDCFVRGFSGCIRTSGRGQKNGKYRVKPLHSFKQAPPRQWPAHRPAYTGCKRNTGAPPP